ncbi:helix-turn-helix transcriptional regulator [Streptomyces sp. LUP30]|uniref:helix-turn-helix domain-containing protein n=1 Tax=Streptomyces sp. LUP30 TaxID=1890285 RepID=UPI0008515DCF|nr:helix-turn-helix transcriptional regulator [Streptomyces sp. LUP30]
MDAHEDDVMEFALLLTRLKKRTNHSYAALARPLGMTASTVHRYCTGEAVPPDFTGIAQFAALCRATPEERAELHRRWILAAAARQRLRPSRARRAQTPGGAPGCAAAVAYSRPSGPADDAPEPMPPSTPRPGPASPSEASPRLEQRRRRPGRAVALAASLAVALGGLTGSAAGPPADGAEPSASARVTMPDTSAPVPHSDGDRQESRATADAVPPSASARITTTEPSAPATHSADGAQENERDAGTTPMSPPLTWTADSHVWGELGCDHDYVIAKPPQQVPPPPLPADAGPWAASQGAVHGRDTNVRITVQGRGFAAAFLEALHVRVVNRAVPAGRPGDIAYSMADGCGATLQPRYFAVDLDARRPLPRVMPAGRPDSPSFAVDFPYRVSLQKPEVLLVFAGTESCTCDWYLELDWSSQGRSGTVRIDDHGRPFRTTSIKGLPHYWFRRPAGWVPMTTADGDAETG